MESVENGSNSCSQHLNAGAAVPVLVGTGQHIIDGSSGESVSTSSTITDSQSSRTNVSVPVEELKVAMMDIYNDGIHVDPDDHEGDQVRKLVRTYLFNTLMF